jgi:hypothetical protein
MGLVISKGLTLRKDFLWNETVWNPSMISTALWLDAADSSTITESGGVITSWADKSGNNSTATAAGNPTYSATGSSTGRPSVQLNGTGDYFTSIITGIGSFNALDVYMVVQTAAAAAADTNTAFFWMYGEFGPSPRALSLVSSVGVLSGEYIVFTADAGTSNNRLGSSSYRRSANTLELLNSKNSASGTTLLQNGSAVTLDLANAITTSTNTAPSAIGYTVNSNFLIGGISTSGTVTSTPALKYSELIALSTLASTDTRQRIEGYLAHKWGLTANLPNDHPYKTVGPTP